MVDALLESARLRGLEEKEPEKQNIYPNRLRELREEVGLTQSQLARQLLIPLTTLNRHENENRSLDAVAIERYSRFYGVNPYELFVPYDHEVEYAEA